MVQLQALESTRVTPQSEFALGLSLTEQAGLPGCHGGAVHNRPARWLPVVDLLFSVVLCLLHTQTQTLNWPSLLAAICCCCYCCAGMCVLCARVRFVLVRCRWPCPVVIPSMRPASHSGWGSMTAGAPTA